MTIQKMVAMWCLAFGAGVVSASAGTMDSDHDGMPNDWEITHGLNPYDASDAILDNDVDGVSNLDEYRQRTDPNSFNAVPVNKTWGGLNADFYQSTNFAQRVLSRIDPKIDFNWGAGSPAVGVPTNHFSARWHGDLNVSAEGDYTFTMEADEAADVYLDGCRIISVTAKGGGVKTKDSGVIRLTPGDHRIEVRYYEAEGNSSVRLYWTGPGFSKQIIPSERLKFSAPPVAPFNVIISGAPGFDVDGVAVSRVGENRYRGSYSVQMESDCRIIVFVDLWLWNDLWILKASTVGYPIENQAYPEVQLYWFAVGDGSDAPPTQFYGDYGTAELNDDCFSQYNAVGPDCVTVIYRGINLTLERSRRSGECEWSGVERYTGTGNFWKRGTLTCAKTSTGKKWILTLTGTGFGLGPVTQVWTSDMYPSSSVPDGQWVGEGGAVTTVFGEGCGPDGCEDTWRVTATHFSYPNSGYFTIVSLASRGELCSVDPPQETGGGPHYDGWKTGRYYVGAKYPEYVSVFIAARVRLEGGTDYEDLPQYRVFTQYYDTNGVRYANRLQAYLDRDGCCPGAQDGSDDWQWLYISMSPVIPLCAPPTGYAPTDFDGDGLSDADEIAHGTDPTMPDTDNDGMSDGFEVSHGFNPNWAYDAVEDSDQDGYLNVYEAYWGTDVHDPLSIPLPTHVVDVTAYSPIQTAINLATNDYDIVLVPDGTNRLRRGSHGDENIEFGGKRIMLTSTNGARNCVIDLPNTGRGFVFSSGESAYSVLRGITILNGKSDMGGGILCDGSSPTILDCRILHCTSTGSGGGLALVNGSASHIERCTIQKNQAGLGGGVFIEDSWATLQNCMMGDNYAGEGGGLYITGTALGARINQIDGCVIVRNTSDGVVLVNASNVTVRNSIVWDNAPGQIRLVGPPEGNAINYSCVQDGIPAPWTSTGCMTSNPSFYVDGLHLRAESACVNSGDPARYAAGDFDCESRPVGDRCDMGMDEYKDTDLDGLPDWWELLHGLNPLSDAGADGALGNPDGDASSNLEEYQSGQNPQKSSLQGSDLIIYTPWE